MKNHLVKKQFGLWFVLFSFMLLPFAVTKAAQFPDFTQLVEDNHQAVVNISTVRSQPQRGQDSIPPQFRGIPEEFLRHFFGAPPQGQRPPQNRRSQSVGSGFIISQDGYILTNHHVIDDADEVIVRLSDRQEYKAEVIGSDPRTDVALLKVDARNLPVVKTGHSDDLRVGEWVLAIGAPFGLDYTVTAGIVSAKGRNLPDDSYVPFIQTDVAINPGNSGGPLINLKGEVIGINAQIFTRSGGFMGLSFAIPIEIAMDVVAQLKATGRVERGFLGVQVQEVTSELARSFGMDKPRGALVTQAYPDTPAERAGIESGDIILKFDGRVINKSTDLPPAVGVTPLDKEVEVVILRQGQEMTIRTKIAPLSEMQTAEAERNGVYQSQTLQVKIEALSEEELKELNLPFGVRVLEVEEGLARKNGIISGDIIVSINFQPMRQPQDVDQILSRAQAGQSLPVRVVRSGRSNFIALQLD